MNKKKKTYVSTHFSKWLCRFMSDHEISVRLLADKIGVSDRLIRQWKTGNSQPRFISGIYLVKALAQITKMKEEQIFYEIANRILKDN